MISPRAGWVACLGLALAALTGGQAAGQTIPALHGKTLSGAPVDLPAQLKGKAGVLVLGFTQGAKDETKIWGLRLAKDFYSSPNVLYYEVPVVAGVPKLMRGLVVGRIADEVSDRGKVHFVPADDHEAEWKSLAGYSKGDEAYVLVVDANGVVRWRTAGAETEATYAQLRQQVEALLAGH